MEHTAEEYGDYWSGSVRIAAGVLLVWLGSGLVGPFVEHGRLGPTAVGAFIVGGSTLVGTYLATLGLARVIRTAVAAENRR